MENSLKTYQIITAMIVFVVFPMLFYWADGSPRRAFYKESISAITFLAFFSTMLQFLLSRANRSSIRVFKASRIFKCHQILGYLAGAILLLHPLFVVLPRFFKPGISAGDAIKLILTSYDNKGVLLGIIAYIFLFFLVIQCFLRRIIPISYKTWRTIHGLVSILFIVTSPLHTIILSRHCSLLLNLWIIVVASLVTSVLLKLYLVNLMEAIKCKKEKYLEESSLQLPEELQG